MQRRRDGIYTGGGKTEQQQGPLAECGLASSGFGVSMTAIFVEVMARKDRLTRVAVGWDGDGKADRRLTVAAAGLVASKNWRRCQAVEA